VVVEGLMVRGDIMSGRSDFQNLCKGAEKEKKEKKKQRGVVEGG
jgi:hypothetical protein